MLLKIRVGRILRPMCVTFTPATPTVVHQMTELTVATPYPAQTFPGYRAPIIKAGSGNGGGGDRMTVATALFGLIPPWAKDRTFGRRTYNARSETVASKPSFRSAWRQRRFCLVPMQGFFEPCWETGRAVPWRIHRQDGQPFMVAALWESWTDNTSGEIVESFSMLTINADGHPVMGRFYRPGDEKRSVVIVPPSQRDDWLVATTSQASAMLQAMAADEFTATPSVSALAPTP